jgi:hypothetical protein
MTLPRRLLVAAALAFSIGTAEARTNTQGGAAIDGYDPVAYHTESRPVLGKREFTHRWDNATWRFASAQNRDLFAANPQRYAPAYGGFCAYAVSEGYTATIEPNAWRIVDGRLFLNYSTEVRARWEQDASGRISRGDANWPGIARSGR